MLICLPEALPQVEFYDPFRVFSLHYSQILVDLLYHFVHKYVTSNID